VNDAGHESGNDAMTAGRDLPLLQDTRNSNVWRSWDVTFRDVVILGPDNEVFAVYNVTSNSLAIPANRDELKRLLRAAAGS
jgi:hypothetical protein